MPRFYFAQQRTQAKNTTRRAKHLRVRTHLRISSINLLVLACCYTALWPTIIHAQMLDTPTFGDELRFIQRHDSPVVLSSADKQAKLIVSPRHQGRVLISTALGDSGPANGWYNRDAIKHNRAGAGGEDRFWLSPLGSQYSIFYPPETYLGKDYWRIPPSLQSTPSQILAQSSNGITLYSEYQVENYLTVLFDVAVTRQINLFSRDQVHTRLGIQTTLPSIGFESVNTLRNIGADWQENYGLVGPWVLGAFPANRSTIAIVPFKPAHPGNQVSTHSSSIPTYIHPINEDRLSVQAQHALFKVDGRYKSKIGVKAAHTKPVMGYYDPTARRLTIVSFSFTGKARYPHAGERFQFQPYNGDVISIYNNGPGDGTVAQQPSFFELESASALLPLKHQQTLTHSHQTFHFIGNIEELNPIARKVLGYSLDQLPTF